MLTLLQLQPVGNSCFSAQQVRELYIRSGQPIVSGMTLEEQLGTLDLDDIYKKVMINPVDSELDPAVLYDLQMSYRPILKHNDALGISDMSGVLFRYVYWLQNINVLSVHVLDEVSHNKLRNATQRFSVGLRFANKFWSCVLVDLEAHSFEFYDPSFTDLSQLTDVADLFETAKLLDPQMETKTVQLIHRGFESKPDPKNCGLSVLGFMHYRIVENKDFDEIVNSKDLLHCDKLRRVFFQNQETRFVSKCVSEFPEAVNQLARIDFGSFLDYLVKIVDDLTVKQELRELESALNKPGVNEKLVLKIQERLIHILPASLTEYIGTDVWQRIVEEICSDPLTHHLRTLDAKQRLSLFLELYEDMSEHASSFAHHVTTVLNAYQVPSKNPIEFLEWSASKKSRSSFGVHFLREMSNWMARKKLPVTKISQAFPMQSLLAKPIHSVDDIRNVLDRCD